MFSLVHALMDQTLAFEIACLSILQVKARGQVIASLQSLLTTSDNPVEKRRILATLTSASSPMRVPPPRKRLIDPPEPVRTLSLPRADLTPDQVLHNLSCALYRGNNDANGKNQGLATFVAHCEYRATIDHAPLNPDDQHASIDTLARSGLMKLRGWTDARQVPPPPPDRLATGEQPPEPGTRTTLSCVYDIPDKPQLRVTYHLSKDTVNTRHPDCWLIRAITTATPAKDKGPKLLDESHPNHPKNYYRTSSTRATTNTSTTANNTDTTNTNPTTNST